jgi:hypothetical protein
VRRARARQTDDECRRRDRLALDGGVRAALGFHAQQVVEQGDEQLAHGDAAERREGGLVAIRLQQSLERLGEIPRAVIAVTGTRSRRAVQALDVERRRLDAEPPQRATARVQSTDSAADAGLREAH